jgi:hypothetical protein
MFPANNCSNQERLFMADDSKFTELECHRKFAASIFNDIWRLLGQPSRTSDEDEEMLAASYASCYHWRKVGTSLNQARGEWMISHVNVILGRGQAALHHAKRSLTICLENSYGDFDLAYAYEGLARAQAAAGDKKGFAANLKLASEAGEKIAGKEDRELFLNDLTSGPWFSMRD